MPKNRHLRLVQVIILWLCSFAAPYIIENFVRLSENIYTFEQMLDSLPIYTVGAVYFVLTALIEVPIIYNVFKKSAENRKMFFLSVVGINSATTIFTVLIERIFCRGHW